MKRVSFHFEKFIYDSIRTFVYWSIYVSQTGENKKKPSIQIKENFHLKNTALQNLWVLNLYNIINLIW